MIDFTKIPKRPRNFNYNPDTSESINQDLEDLLSLAESTSKEIGSFRDSLMSIREAALSKLFYAYGFMTLLTVFYFTAEKYLLSVTYETRTTFRAAMLVLLFIFLFLFIKNLSTSIKNRKKINRELEIEKEVQIKLISMVFDQFNRAKQKGSLTLISQALIDIRIQRLKADI